MGVSPTVWVMEEWIDDARRAELAQKDSMFEDDMCSPRRTASQGDAVARGGSDPPSSNLLTDFLCSKASRRRVGRRGAGGSRGTRKAICLVSAGTQTCSDRRPSNVSLVVGACVSAWTGTYEIREQVVPHLFRSRTTTLDTFAKVNPSIMKISALILLTFASAASAFVPSVSSSRASTTLAARPDASAAIQEALEASKKFGPTSKEARVAWDIVEELDASDNR